MKLPLNQINVLNTLRATIIVGIFILVNQMDYEDAIREQSQTATSRPLATTLEQSNERSDTMSETNEENTPVEETEAAEPVIHETEADEADDTDDTETV